MRSYRLSFAVVIACLTIGPTTLLAPLNSVSAQTIQFYPIRIAPLGSPAGTVGDPVTPTFNDALDCWELKVPGSVEVDIDLQAGGWGNAAGNPALGAVQATVISAGYSNGIGADLNPKGWPEDPGQGAYQARHSCEAGGDGSPCVPPFDLTCSGNTNGICVPSPNWIFRPFMDANDLPAIATPTLNYGWATAAQRVYNTYDPDPSSFGSFGGLILEVPLDASGTYVIAVNPDPNNSFLNPGCAGSYSMFKAACITVIGACCVDTDSDGYRDSCLDDSTETECVGANGLFLGDGGSCTGAVGACSLDDDGDGVNDTCRVMDQTCCEAAGGLFLGAYQPCNDVLGACCLEDDAVCIEMGLSICVEQHGSFQGIGTACGKDEDGDGFNDACGEVIPAVSEWGLVVLALLLLVGIKICFARRRPTSR